MPNGIDAIPRRGDLVGGVFYHAGLHRRSGKEGARLERQQLLAIGRSTLYRRMSQPE